MEDELVAAGQLADVPRILDFVELACRRSGVVPDAWLDLQLAVEEASTNVIEHAYAGLGGEFWIRFAAIGSDVVITLRDRGKAFDPSSIPEPDFTLGLEERPLGGLGLHLMYQLMDEVRFSFSEEEGNTLVMIKRGVVAQNVHDPSGGPRKDG